MLKIWGFLEKVDAGALQVSWKCVDLCRKSRQRVILTRPSLNPETSVTLHRQLILNASNHFFANFFNFSHGLVLLQHLFSVSGPAVSSIKIHQESCCSFLAHLSCAQMKMKSGLQWDKWQWTAAVTRCEWSWWMIHSALLRTLCLNKLKTFQECKTTIVFERVFSGDSFRGSQGTWPMGNGHDHSLLLLFYRHGHGSNQWTLLLEKL